MEVTLGRLRDRHPRIKVHRIVAEQFVPNPNNYAEVNHIDYNRTNNHFSNLEWCTHQYNILHSQKAGHYKNKSGESNGRSKLTYDIVCNIRKDYADGMKICDISKKYNRPWSTINNVVKNHTWIMED